jgi:multiple sugar transport system substrate-binding protein
MGDEQGTRDGGAAARISRERTTVTSISFAHRALVLGCAASLVAAGLAGCSSSSSAGDTKSSGKGGGTYALWDPYPQFDATSQWVKTINACGTQAGVTIKRTGYDTTDLTNKVLFAAQQNAAPNVLVVDNPVVSTLADGGILESDESLNLDTSQVEPNILAAGQLDGKTYGVPIGANTLALYYNKKILSAAGVDPSTIKDWATLTDALQKVKAAGKKGITFSAIGTEEGSFQFLPWLWGAGATLTDLSSTKAQAALQLWQGWLNKGYAPNSVLQNTQTTSWQEFASGDFAFGENGTWNLQNAKKAAFQFGILPIPGQSGGSAPAPTGGEFVTVPVNSDKAKEATAAKVVSCLAGQDHALVTDTALAYVSAIESIQQQQVSADPDLTNWVAAVHAAKGRTSDNLGTKYPKISEAMWGAVQAALSGSKSVQSALSDAQSKAGSSG